MKVTDAFLGEHGVFYAQFDRLEETVLSEDRIDVLRGQAALLASALAPHAKLEDDLLFGAMDRIASAGSGPTAIMRAEHEAIEVALQGLESSTDTKAAREMFLEAIHLARSHFLKEESVAFPMAEEVLGRETLERLGEEWARARGVVLAL